MNDCKFCEDLISKKEIVWENNFYFSKFDGNPVSPGHALLIPKRHFSSISDLSNEEKADFINSTEKAKEVILKADLSQIYSRMIENAAETSRKFITRAISALTKNSEISGFNYGINEGEDAGQTVKHLHLHIIPRYAGDVGDPIGGVRNTIPGMGNYRK